MPSKHLKGRAVPLSAGSYQEEHPWSALLTGKLGYFSFLEQFLPTESGRGSYTGHHSSSPIPIPTHSGGRDEAPTYITDQLLFYLNQLLEIVLEQYSTHGTAWTPHEWPCSDTHHAHMQTCTHTHTHTHTICLMDSFTSWATRAMQSRASGMAEHNMYRVNEVTRVNRCTTNYRVLL